MSTFVGRGRELADLDAVLAQGGAQFILVYGRWWVGKTTLVLRWAACPFTMSSLPVPDSPKPLAPRPGQWMHGWWIWRHWIRI